jgi:cation diffusion facilitator CzcD-associated flavoprotein CzcO
MHIPCLSPHALQAVIGAGPAGLAAAQQLLQEGHIVVVFEAGPAVGGAWHFDSSTDSDPLGLDPQRVKVHSSM